jgi:hypothetical protein
MTDRATVQSVVRLLGLLALLCVGGLIFLADRGNLSNETSIALVGLASAAAGGIAGLLAKTDSVDVAGLEALNEQREQSFLPVLQAQLDRAKDEGRSEALSQYVPATLEAFEPRQGEQVIDVDHDDPGDPGPDPFGDEQPSRPLVE